MKLWLKLLQVFRRHPIRLAFVGAFASLIFCALLLATAYQLHYRNKPYIFGVSFSLKTAEEFGLNWQLAYEALLDDLGFKKLRLMSYWDRHEPIQDQYDFSELDWQMDEAAEGGARISLAIGLRQPRWPECHEPAWAKRLDSNARRDELLEYLRAVVTRYRNHPALESYQLENEVANQRFGECQPFDRKKLIEEKQLVDALDSAHPLIINTSNQTGIPLGQPRADKVGFSVYRKSHGRVLDQPYYWSFWYVPPHWHSLRALVLEWLTDVPVFIHELQAEPWGPRPTQELSVAEQNHSMDRNRLINSIRFAKQTGIREIYLWGGEWWFWRKTTGQDATIWEAVRESIQSDAVDY